MRILHTSDMHGRFEKILYPALEVDFDIWVDTGDWAPNLTRGNFDIEVTYQCRYFMDFETEIISRLKGRPVLSVSGNHDYACLATLLRYAGHEESYTVNEDPVHISSNGKILTFAGFREIPYIAGEWNGERKDLEPYITRALSFKPHILLTHTPPAGIMDFSDDGGHIGSNVLANKLLNEKHNITHNFFGHVHGQRGIENHRGITFVNSAEGATFIEV